VTALESYLTMLSQSLATHEQQLTEAQQRIVQLEARLSEGPPVQAVPEEAAGPDASKSRKALKAKIDSYHWQSSIWDLALFVGVVELPAASSLFVFLLAVTNAVMQVVLCLIINDAFAFPQIDRSTVDAMRKWRVFSGHSYYLVDKQTFEPLAKRICEFDDSIPMSSGARGILGLIAQYLATDEDRDRHRPYLGRWLDVDAIGIILCVLALIIWLLNLSVRLSKMWKLMTAMQQLNYTSNESKSIPHGLAAFVGKTEIKRPADGERELVSVSRHRKLYWRFILAIQLIILCLLGISGTFYIIFTLQLRDLLLNCSALLIVLDLDELFFEALAPRKARHLMLSLKPLPRPKPFTVKGMNWTPCAVLCAVALIVGVTSIQLIQQAGDLQDTREAICGGNRNFVAVLDKAGVVTAGNAQMFKSPEDTYYYKSMRQLISNSDGTIASSALAGGTDGASLSATVTGMTSAQWSLVESAQRSVVDVMHLWNTKCVDMIPGMVYRTSGTFLHILQDTFQNYSIQECASIARYCSYDDPRGVRARQICSSTCGCDSANSSLILGGINGCAPSCTITAKYKASVDRSCTQDVGKNDPFWSKYIEGIYSLKASYPDGWTDDFDGTIAKIKDKGCAFAFEKNLSLGFVGWENPCEESPIFVKPLTLACPVSCECKAYPRHLCPKECFQ